MFAADTRAFVVALGPALLVLAAHYAWVLFSAVSFEEASIAKAEKRATRLAAFRAGNLRTTALKKLRDLDRWTALLAACPLHAHLLDGTPLTDLVSLGGILDRRRRFVVDGAPVVTGLLAVGDAWACTNPSLGRGITMGLMHAAGTREVVRRHLDDPGALARAHDEMTERRLTPWYRNTVELDRMRGARLVAAAEGRALPEPSDPPARIRTALPIASQFDADLFRAFIEMTSLLALPSEVLGRPGLVDRILEVVGRRPPPAPPGPSRAETLRILA